MAIYNVPFSVYERLASAKMNAFESAINAHTHDGVYGVKIPFTALDGYLQASQISAAIITGTMIANATITGANVAAGTLTLSHLNLSGIHLSGDGYAVYAP